MLGGRKQILVADDEANIRRVLSAQLQADGHDVHEVGDGWLVASRGGRGAGGDRVDRVKAFPIGQMALCTADAGAGYGGLGQPGSITLAPGESFEAARWDGILREEVLDPQRGVCARELAPTAARYRFRLDQPQLEGAPNCEPAVTAWPIAEDAGVPVLEIRCRNAVRDAGVRAAPGA